MTNQKHILFLCPHAAAKSVLAMTYFRDLARKVNLNATASNAGTEPDPVINPAVDQYLKQEGFDLTGFAPPLLGREEINAADIIVSIGCIQKEDVPKEKWFLDWSDVPMLSEDFEGSRARIYQHTQVLIQNLLGEGMATL